jgi:hypothetical protein
VNLLTGGAEPRPHGAIVHTRRAFGASPVDDRPTPGDPVPLLARIRAFLASPQGRRFSDQGRRYAADPRNQQRARSLLARLRRR